MKIFNRPTETKTAPTPTPAPANAPTAEAPARGAAPAGPAAASGASMPVPAPVAAPAVPDLSAILDTNVKEMSEKIARLASTLESSQEDRSGFEAKLAQMEERMRKLSSLTEMISAQYNPFVGEVPAERDVLPHPEVGLAPPVVAPPSSLMAPPPPSAPPMFEFPEEPAETPSEPAPAPLPPPAPAPIAEPAPENEPGVYLWSVPAGFEPSMLLLGWADMLLKSAGDRQSLLELVNYYHNIGWIGDPARDQLLAYADGLSAPEQGGGAGWRADVDLHERSLLFVEKLRAVAHRKAG